MISIPPKVKYDSHVTCAQWEALRACWDQILAQRPDVCHTQIYRYSYSSYTFTPGSWPTAEPLQTANNDVYSYAMCCNQRSAGLTDATALGATTLRASRDPSVPSTSAKISGQANVPWYANGNTVYAMVYQTGCVIMSYVYMEP